MQDMTVRFSYEKATPGTHRFQEVDENGAKLTRNTGAVIGTLYLDKNAVKNGTVPKSLMVTIKGE